MAATISSTLSAGLSASRKNVTTGGITSTVQVSPPNGGQTGYATGGTPSATKMWTGTLNLAGAATTLDLTNLAGGDGDIDLTGHVFALGVQNNATTTGYNVTVGNAAGTIFNFGLGGTTPTIAVAPSSTLALGTAAGWVVSSSLKSLKLDPGANTVSVTLTLVSGA